MIIVNPPRSYAVRSVTQGRPVAMTMEMLNGFGQTETIIEKEVVDWKTVGTFAALAIILVLVLSSGSQREPIKISGSRRRSSRLGAFELKHFHTVPIRDRDWAYLEDGHDLYDSRGTGGAWYYKGDKEEARAKLAEYKVEQRKRMAAYYAQPWV